MNYARDVVDAAGGDALALIELRRDGGRRAWTFGEVSSASARLAGHFTSHGLEKGDVVLIWLGNRSEWVLSMLACFRLGLVAASCPEQLRAKDLKLRTDAIRPGLVVADERNRDELDRVELPCPVAWVPDPRSSSPLLALPSTWIHPLPLWSRSRPGHPVRRSQFSTFSAT